MPRQYCFFPVVLNAQVTITNQSLTDSSLAIVYRGAENKIKILPGRQLITKVSAVNASLAKSGPGNYIINPGSRDSVTLYCYNRDSLIFRKAFVNLPLGKLVPKFGNIPADVMFTTVNELLANTMISVELANCYYKHDLVPLSYRFKVENDKTHYEYKKYNLTNKLSAVQVEILQYCTPGTTIILDDFHAKDKNNRAQAIFSRLLIIK